MIIIGEKINGATSFPLPRPSLPKMANLSKIWLRSRPKPASIISMSVLQLMMTSNW